MKNSSHVRLFDPEQCRSKSAGVTHTKPPPSTAPSHPLSYYSRREERRKPGSTHVTPATSPLEPHRPLSILLPAHPRPKANPKTWVHRLLIFGVPAGTRKKERGQTRRCPSIPAEGRHRRRRFTAERKRDRERTGYLISAPGNWLVVAWRARAPSDLRVRGLRGLGGRRSWDAADDAASAMRLLASTGAGSALFRVPWRVGRG